MATLTPAYGRDYRSANEAKADYEAGKDFILNDVSSRWNGSYISKRDAESVYGDINIRFNNLRNKVVIKST